MNILGQLGLGHTDSKWTPTMIPFFKEMKISDISSGAGHSFAYDSLYNNLYSWGASADFQTGIDVTPSGQAGENTNQLVKSP